ncbi:cutinase family protein [Corynebacterium sp. TAE3-ERU12]|nr:cutinase family protein [Corynebacterium sp. TAE3-ERU12]MBV7296065.1 cutinase family protein [Corynebacterium sp. TAE3-ERU12]
MYKAIVIIAVLALLVAIGVGVGRWMGTSSTPIADDDCPAIEVISTPGTGESNSNDDPLTPAANPGALLLNVTKPLQDSYTPEQVKVYTVPYVAQLRNPKAQHERTYDESQAEGRARLEEEMRATNAVCPNTRFILMGFSQGAVITGDVAAAIGQNKGAVAPDRVAGVAVVADPRRVPDQGQQPSVPVAGVGLEVALLPHSPAVQQLMPGTAMRGAREGGFGEINDRVQEICAPNDIVCDAPPNIDGVARALDYIGSDQVHGAYGGNPAVFPGTTTTQWLIDWSRGLIDQALAQ